MKFVVILYVFSYYFFTYEIVHLNLVLILLSNLMLLVTVIIMEMNNYGKCVCKDSIKTTSISKKLKKVNLVSY